jgi:hypothetical protein
MRFSCVARRSRGSRRLVVAVEHVSIALPTMPDRRRAPLVRSVRFICLAITAFVAGSPRSALADRADTKVKQECAQSADVGQKLRDEGKPLSARPYFLTCARDACPLLVREHCSRWLEQVEASIPSVVVKARVGTGARAIDVTDVVVSVDGSKVADSLDGQALRLEPGGHTVKYERTGSDPVEAHVLLVAGEKNRQLTVEFPATPPGSPSSPSSSGTTPPASGERHTTIRPAAWVFTGLAVVAGTSFAYFGATGKSELDSLRATCAGHCAQSDVSSAWNKLIVADVSLGVGIVSVGLATWLFLMPRHSDAPPKDAGASGFLVAPSPDGVRVGWQGVF